ncbi:MAG: Smr/MutS family protein [Acidobacteriota bacterium]
MSGHSAVSRATEQALELPSLLRLVAHLASSDLGRDRIETVRPFAERSALEQHRQRFEEVRRLLAAQALVPFCERPFASLLEAIAEGGHRLNGRDLVHLGKLLEVASQAVRRIAETDPPCSALAERIAGIPRCDELAQTLRKTFDPRGEIREDATPRLAELRSRLRRVRHRVYQQLGTVAEQNKSDLREETIPMRGGRLVLMLHAGSRGRIPGLVHGQSGRGKSYYFEPLEAVEENNRLQQTSDEEDAEKRRILAELIQRSIDELPAVRAQAALVGELDALQAAARFAEVSNGRLIELAPRHELKLEGARHPLLDPALAELRHEALSQPGHSDAIVPLELELNAEKRALVVTGPNAGGKTVALKTVGLLVLAHLCGLPIPADASSRLPFFEGVVATVGDEQDLLADRSTFSGRLLRLKEAWEVANTDALILLDELGSGTDPEEGAALSTALLEGLLERRCLVLVTTHLSQLAATALETGGAFCAAMQFDAETGKPTYRLLPGPPGGSEALALAQRLELPRSWIERAEALLGSEHRDLRRLLTEVEAARQDLANRQREVETEIADASKLRQRLATETAALAEERKTLGRSFKRKLDAFQDDIRRQLSAEVERLRKQLEGGRKRNLASAAAERLFTSAPVFEDESSEAGGIDLVVGCRVKHRRLGWEGNLEKLDRGKARVEVSGKAFNCRQQDLVAIAEANMQRRSPKPARPQPSFRAPAKKPDAAGEPLPRELKLIGERVEPALERLERFIDQALLASLPSIRVVHGHGSGRLRTAVRQQLRRHPAVASHRPGRAEEGGDGATIAVFRDT